MVLSFSLQERARNRLCRYSIIFRQSHCDVLSHIMHKVTEAVCPAREFVANGSELRGLGLLPRSSNVTITPSNKRESTTQGTCLRTHARMDGCCANADRARHDPAHGRSMWKTAIASCDTASSLNTAISISISISISIIISIIIGSNGGTRRICHHKSF